MPKRLFVLLVSVILILTACDSSPETPPTPVEEISVEPTVEPVEETQTVVMGDPAVLVSEVLTGVNGNNNLEFIELYNTGTTVPFDLQGWSIWYKLADGQEETLVYRWSGPTLLPPQGHYLLVREGQDVGVTADAYFTQPLVGPKGALQLRQTDGAVLDSLSWGTGPADYAEGTLAPAMENGTALERVPGGVAGNWTDSGDNAKDFALNADYNPQNTGSPIVPEPTGKLALTVAAPITATPGSQFDYVLTLTNETGQAVNGVTVQFPFQIVFRVF